MTRLVFICKADDGLSEHDTQILMKRCVYCRQWAIAGYRCGCGVEDEDNVAMLMGHGKGECTP